MRLTDPTILGGSVQAVAAVTAVLIGWLLSVLNERRSWRRRKVELLREKQVEMLIEAGTELRAAQRAVRKILERLEEVLRIKGDSTLDARTSDLLLTEQTREAGKLADGLNDVLIRLETIVVGLELIGFGEDGLDLLRATRESVDRFYSETKLLASSQLADFTRLEALGKNFNRCSAELNARGRESLSG